nr:calcium-binding protein [uncultured Sphingomonas sp.]
MADYFNVLGSSTVTGGTGPDRFFLFNKDTNLDRLRADGTVANFIWNTSLHWADGSVFQLIGINVNISMDLIIGDKTDALYGSNFNDAIVYNNGGFGDGLGGFRDIQLMYLGGGDDLVDLTAHGVGGVAYAKDMKIYAGDGNDTIVGGAGADILYGEAGDDLILGFAGADVIYGGDGNDILYGEDLGYDNSSSYDTLYGQRGNDILYGGGRNDKLDGGDGNDILYGGADDDSLIGGSGDDILYGDDLNNSGNDKLSGGAGNDQLYGRAGNDELHGDAGDDLIDGGAGRDYLGGDAGADTILAGAGDDTIDGGDDSDTVVFTGNRTDYRFTVNADGSLTLGDLRSGSPDGTDTIRNVEYFAFADGTVSTDHLNTPPVIVSNGGGPTAAIDIVEGATGVLATVLASDADVGQSLRYAIGGGVDAALFRIDAATGEMSFVTAPDFEDPYDANGDNSYEVTVIADDGFGGVARQALTIKVADASDGSPPTITSDGGMAAGSISILENSTSVTTIQAIQPDGLPLSYRIVGGADAQQFVIDANTGALSFAVAPDRGAPGDANHDNIYDVVIGVSDGTNGDHQRLAVTVTDVNDNPPVLTSFGGAPVATLSLAENTTGVAVISASDADGTAATYQILSGDDAALFAIDSVTGALSFKNAPDFEQPLDANGDNIYSVVVGASDGVTTVTQALSISVGNVNDLAPVIQSNGAGATAQVAMLENSSFVTTVTATDGDGTIPTYAIIGGADAAFFAIDGATGALRFVKAPDFEFVRDANGDNVYDVIVSASDGAFTDTQALGVQILDVNEIGRTLTGTSAANIFSPTAPGALQTTDLNDTIYALAGNDVIDGGLGADRMEGGTGNDTYYVDTWSDDGFAGNDDLVVETPNAGTDLVISSVSYQLTAEVENLTLVGGALAGTGNILANTITGNALDNILDGGAGNDRLLGGDGADTLFGADGTDVLNGEAGNDSLFGGAGSDVLDGGTGADHMEGGTENDTYYVDSWSDDGNAANDDVVIELAGGGTGDLVNASVTYRLADQVERLTLTGSAAIDGYGNALDNVMTGNSAANLLSGDLGNDTIDGGDGNDILQGGEGNDVLSGSGGDDRLFGGNGVDKLDGGNGNDLLDGGASNDTLLGQAGDDILIGGKGKDVMTGGAGADTFTFAFGDTSANSGFIDTITDFDGTQDSIDIDVFTSALSHAAYAEQAIASNDYSTALAAAKAAATPGIAAVFIAGTTDGWVFWDGNGDGALDQAVTLQGANALAAFDAHHLF